MARILAKYIVLATKVLGGNVVDPNGVRAGESQCITTPHILRVKIRNHYVLDNNVRRAVGEPEALAQQDTLAIYTKDGLVRGDFDTFRACHRR